MPQAKRLGEILVQQGTISPKTRDRVLKRARILGRRFGSVLEDLELVTGEELALALASQYQYRTVTNLTRVRLDPQLLQLIPVEVALHHQLIPLKREGQHLAVAMADPTDCQVLNNLAEDNKLLVTPLIATKREIREAISHHYFGHPLTTATERTVLIADENRQNLQMLADLLHAEGYRVLTVRDGLDAFRQVIGHSPHVLLIDLNLPKLNSYGLLNALKNSAETSFIPMILLTDPLDDEEDEVRAFERGFFDVVIRPLHLASVRARVKRAFHFYDHQYRLF